MSSSTERGGRGEGHGEEEGLATDDSVGASSSAVRDVEERMGVGEVDKKKRDEGARASSPGERAEGDGESVEDSDGDSEDESSDESDGESDKEGDGEGDTKKRDDVVEASSSDE